MGVFQSQSRFISTEPRAVVLLSSRTPGTRRTDASSGRVTARSICSAGSSPASAITVMRGNVTLGRIAAGACQADQAPITSTHTNANRIARRCARTPSKNAITAVA